MSSVRRRRLYLVRHGHVSYFDELGKPLDPRHVQLSPDGIAQVGSLADAMRGIRLDRIVCSDLARAVQTAQLLADGIGCTARPEPRSAVREIRAGRLREIAPDELEASLAYAYGRAAEEGAAFVGGELFAAFAARVTADLAQLLDEPQWESAAIVSHDAVNRVLLCWAAGQGLSAMAAFEQDMCCANIIDVDMVGPRVVRRLIRAVNFTPYDPLKRALHATVMEGVYRAYRPQAA
jgi:probable phosphoglycerate mutase